MKNNAEHVLKALSGLIPEEAQDKVSGAISAFLEQAVTDLEAEYEEKLDEAYEELRKDKLKNERIAEEGYNQAWDLISEYKDRIVLQREEFDQAIDEGFDEAYAHLEEERRKNDTLESELYEEFENKLGDIRKFLVNKVDEFFQVQGEKYYEMARKDLLNDPVFAEHKLAFERILEAAATVLSDEDFAIASNGKVEQLVRESEELKGQLKTVESKNMRLSMENNKLNEAVRSTQNLLTESVRTERKERVERARKVQGRGAGETERQVVIGEQNDNEPVRQRGPREERIVEEVAQEVANYWNYLSGVNKPADEEDD